MSEALNIAGSQTAPAETLELNQGLSMYQQGMRSAFESMYASMAEATPTLTDTLAEAANGLHESKRKVAAYAAAGVTAVAGMFGVAEVAGAQDGASSANSDPAVAETDPLHLNKDTDPQIERESFRVQNEEIREFKNKSHYYINSINVARGISNFTASSKYAGTLRADRSAPDGVPRTVKWTEKSGVSVYEFIITTHNSEVYFVRPCATKHHGYVYPVDKKTSNGGTFTDIAPKNDPWGHDIMQVGAVYLKDSKKPKSFKC